LTPFMAFLLTIFFLHSTVSHVRLTLLFDFCVPRQKGNGKNSYQTLSLARTATHIIMFLIAFCSIHF
jgi:hypothetical protein